MGNIAAAITGKQIKGLKEDLHEKLQDVVDRIENMERHLEEIKLELQEQKELLSRLSGQDWE